MQNNETLPLSTWPNLLLRPKATTTAVIDSSDVQTLQFPDGSRSTFQSTGACLGLASMAQPDDATSMMSVAAPTQQPTFDLASLITSEKVRKSAAWHLLQMQSSTALPFETSRATTGYDILETFEAEFDPIPNTDCEPETNLEDEAKLVQWKSKLKHYLILSSAGKPIYSRHGDISLVNSFVGVIQTIVSSYQNASNPLQTFTAGDARFVISIQGPLYFVAISRLGESETQLRAQLDALYMQILSILTLPNLISIFTHRPNTDLRKSLAGTESLLSSLADSFTRGSPPVLLGALECLKIRKSYRAAITSTFLNCRVGDDLLYGMIVAGGRLVSVIRPRRHSLHPSDLELIFNMLFEGGGLRSREGEHWIPICLPAFNNRGYLYMYVSFFNVTGGTRDCTTSITEWDNLAPPAISSSPSRSNPIDNADGSLAIVLISPSPTSFFDLQSTRNALVSNLSTGPHISHLRDAIAAGRPSLAMEISPGIQLSHFLYKSRANVQFCMPSFSPLFDNLLSRRKLMSLYHSLHASVHTKNCHLNVLHCVTQDSTSLAWVTPVFELYCVAGPNLSRTTMTKTANEIVRWVKKEEERLFIIGGGVF